MIGEEFNMKSLEESKGYVESAATSLDEGDVVQFEREGFFKLDDKAGEKFISL